MKKKINRYPTDLTEKKEKIQANIAEDQNLVDENCFQLIECNLSIEETNKIIKDLIVEIEKGKDQIEKDTKNLIYSSIQKTKKPTRFKVFQNHVTNILLQTNKTYLKHLFWGLILAIIMFWGNSRIIPIKSVLNMFIDIYNAILQIILR